MSRQRIDVFADIDAETRKLVSTSILFIFRRINFQANRTLENSAAPSNSLAVKLSMMYKASITLFLPLRSVCMRNCITPKKPYRIVSPMRIPCAHNRVRKV